MTSTNRHLLHLLRRFSVRQANGERNIIEIKSLVTENFVVDNEVDVFERENRRW